MAADDDDRGATPDPWDEIVAGNLEDEAAEGGFSFEEGAPGGTPDPVEPREAADEPASEPDDAHVEDWLRDVEGEAESGPLSVFDPDGDDAAADVPADVSGAAEPAEADAVSVESEMSVDAETDGEAEHDGWTIADAVAGETAADAEAGGLPAVALTAAAAAGSTAGKKVVRQAAKPRKAGGIGQIVGVVMGALLAFPIVAGILIGLMWLGWTSDTMGLRKTFLRPLLPPVAKSPSAAAADVAGGSALDQLPVPPSADEAAVDAAPDAAEPALPEPTDVADADADMPATPAPEPESEPVVDVAAVDVPGAGLDDLPAPQPAPAPPAPPPLDTAVLDEAVGEAEALGRALGVVEDRANPAYKKLRIRWYRALARVAEELVKVENAAATSGRPLAAAPDNVAALHGGIGGQEVLVAELAACAPDWLAYAKRGSDGVVLPATFETARRVGPYWSARLSFVGSDGKPRGLTVISAREPVAIAGDPVIVTGVALEEAVIWAADVRAAGGGGDLSAGF